jgi:hypothetical protein
MRELGRGDLYLNSRPWTAKMTPERAAVLRPLLEAQDYVGKVVHGDNSNDRFIDFSTFRNGGLIYGVNLMTLQSDWVKAGASPEPWLTVSPSARARGRVVCHRSPRYQNPYFRWDLLGEALGTKMLFVGLPHEAEALRRETGVEAEYVETRDYLELAELIAGADLFIGNQSSPMALAIGLGVPFIQELCMWTPDCVYPRRQGYYCYDGEIPEFDIPGFNPPPDIDRHMMPSGGWQIISKNSGERIAFKSHTQATRYLQIVDRYISEEKAAQEVDRQNVLRIPTLVRRNSAEQIFGKIRRLLST